MEVLSGCQACLSLPWKRGRLPVVDFPHKKPLTHENH